MEFALSEDQRILKDSLDLFLKEKAPLETIRVIANGDRKFAQKLEEELKEMGLNGLVVPEAEGGLGLGILDACLVQEALGYSVAPSGFLANTIVCRAMAGKGADFLPGVISGDVQFVLAIQGLVSSRDGASVDLDASGLSGHSLMALSAPDTTHLCLVTDSGKVCITDAFDEVPLVTIDRTREVSKVTVSGSSVIADAADPTSLLATARLLIAADTLGAAQAMLDKAVTYAAERRQFGRVIGSFQAVKHMCAEMAARLEPCRALVWHAAHALDTGDDEGVLMATLAKAHLSEVGTYIARTATEVHGGMGFTDLLGLHYWFKRIGLNRQLLGNPQQVRQDAARLQGFISD